MAENSPHKKHYEEPSAAERTVALSELMELICERLYEGQTVELMPHGTSMLPTIRDGQDSVILEAISARLKKYDVALYMRQNGVYVLHRVIDVTDEGYVFIGDNQFVKESGITDLHLLARVAKYRRGDRLVSADSFSERARARLIHTLRPIRYFALRVRRKLGRIFGRLFGKNKK
ncbi:MAG: S24/S26 family peptidase [Clostridia bacterium]|nr:S24/S26 family peptidase [Clostridia bacterium]